MAKYSPWSQQSFRTSLHILEEPEIDKIVSSIAGLDGSTKTLLKQEQNQMALKVRREASESWKR